ncbi:MAG: hypothetical protein LBV11_17445, partial [Bacillus cereus]|nr:hypothetical protein [Bacillus cereus]
MFGYTIIDKEKLKLLKDIANKAANLSHIDKLNIIINETAKIACLQKEIESLTFSNSLWGKACEYLSEEINRLNEAIDIAKKLNDIERKSKDKEISELQQEISKLREKISTYESKERTRDSHGRFTKKETSLSDKWRNSVQLKGNYTFDEAQKVAPAGYRVPTHEEFQELVDNTEYSFDEETEECVFKFK